MTDMTTIKGRHRHLDPQPPTTPRRTDPPTRASEDLASLRIQFPPRAPTATWPATQQPREQVLDRLFQPPFLPDNPISRATRRRGLRRLLDWLGDQPGDTWQQRWIASGADAAGNPA
jgi:hypothetical protein